MCRKQHSSIAAVVPRERRDRPQAKRRHSADREGTPLGAGIEQIEPVAEHDEKRHKRRHHEPGPPSVGCLLLEKVHFRIDRSTAGTWRSASL